MTPSTTKSRLRWASLDTRFLIVIVAAITLILVDTIVLKTSVLLSSQLQQDWIPIGFAAVSVALLICQYLIFFTSKTRSKENKELGNTMLTANGLTVGASLIGITLVVTVVSLQIHQNSSFQTFLLTLAVIISYSVAIFAVTILTLRFIRWLHTDRDPLIIAYSTASLVLLLNLVFTMLFAIAILIDKNPLVVPHIGQSVVDIPPGSLKEVLSLAYFYSSMISFVAIWVPTFLLLRYRSEEMGNKRYWIIFLAPLGYFLSQFLFIFFDVLEPVITLSPTFVNGILKVTFALSMPVAGIIFGVAFWFMARSSGVATVRNYLITAAYGSALFFASNQAVVLVYNTFYPPFGLAAMSFTGLSAYLILLGIYSSAVSVSQDRKLLSNIRNSTVKELELLRRMGSAENSDNIVKVVTRLTRDQQAELTSHSGIESSMTEDEIRRAIENALRERKSKRNGSLQ